MFISVTITSFIATWSIIGILVVILHIWGLHFLLTEKNKKVSRLILIHMSCVEIMVMTMEVSYHSTVIYLYLNASSRHMWKYCMTLVLLIAQFQLAILLTLDRVAAVSLGLRYAIIVTKRRVCIAFLVVWFVCVIHIPYPFFTDKSTIYLVWEVTTFVIIVTSYIYILVKIHKDKKESKGMATNGNQRPVKYHIPLLIVSNFLIFIVIPEFVHEFFRRPTWFYILWYLSYICDPLIYTLGRPKTRSRIGVYFNKRKSDQPREATAPSSQFPDAMISTV